MSLTLRDEDRQALDLLLDRSSTASASGGTFYAAGVGRERVNGAEKVLQMLDLLPAADPPADLVARTLRRLDDAEGAPHHMPPILVDATRPVA